MVLVYDANRALAKTMTTTKRYTITGQSSPSEIITYEGSFESVAGQHDIITALAHEFASDSLDDLISWLGGDEELNEIAASGDEYELANDDSVFFIRIHH